MTRNWGLNRLLILHPASYLKSQYTSPGVCCQGQKILIGLKYFPRGGFEALANIMRGVALQKQNLKN